ncbi:MAG: PDZ domain-containing protein [Proteobacteria bacterium]|nr:PDZ domain-containing protein [Pseudomonadota bacterium]
MGAIIFDCPDIIAKNFNAVMDITLQNNKLSILAKNATINDLITSIKNNSGIQIEGLEYRKEDTFSFRINNTAIEHAFKSLLKHLGETSYAFEYKGDKLYRIAVVRESKLNFVLGETSEIQSIPETSDMAENPTDPFLKHSMISQMFKRPTPNSFEEKDNGTSSEDSEEDNESKSTAVKVVRVVKTSQADNAGVHEGDIILDYDGVTIENPEMLIREVQEKTGAENIRMSVSRDGEIFEVVLQGGFIGVSIVPVSVSE